MDHHAEHVHPDVVATLERLVKIAAERHPDDLLLADFLPEYYRELPGADVDDLRIDDVYAVGVAHLALGRRREPGTTVVKVVSPDRDRDGWHSRRSVLLVVTDDDPFLVDTIRMVLDRYGLAIHLLVHPMLDVHRDDDGTIVAIGEDAVPGGTRLVEAWTQVEIDRCDPIADAIEHDVRRVTDDVHRVVADFPAMRERMEAFAHLDPLLAWFADEHFVFLGAASYDTAPDGSLIVQEGSQLGQLRHTHEIDPPPVAPSNGAAFGISRSTAVSTIHRPARMTCVTVFDGTTRHRFLGLLASSAYRQSVLSIPTIGQRARAVLGLTSVGAETHTGRSMRNVLETLPRDLLFETDTEQLAELVTDIVGLQERRIVRVFEVPEPAGAWSTVLVYLPRHRFSAEVPALVAGAVASAYGCEYRDLESLVTASSLARITFTVRRGAASPALDELARQIDELTTSWHDRLDTVLTNQVGLLSDHPLLERIVASVPPDYRATVRPKQAVGDLEHIRDVLSGNDTLTTAMVHDVEAPPDEWRFRVYRRNAPAALSEMLPLLDPLGLQALD
ncbi:MAG TPA: hypothetical protein VGK49_10245, partial [Ilumatobacteraceae bacterium]